MTTMAVPIPGQAYGDKGWTLDDLLYAPTDLGLSAKLAELHAQRRARRAVQPFAPMSADIGNIAVIEDDGTLVNPLNTTDTTAIVQAFYQTHADDNDVVIVFIASTFPSDVEPEAGFAFYQAVRNDIEGIGMGIFDNAAGFGLSTANLKGFINMNDLPEYPADLDQDFLGGVASGVEILGQEVGHMVASFITSSAGDILGRGEAHWSFYFTTEASVLEGNTWTDNGDGTFTTTTVFDGYSELDEYLLGFRPSSQVTTPMFVISNPSGSPVNDSAFPASGVTVTGTRADVTMDELIETNGARVPDASAAPKVLRTALILLVPQDTSASDEDLAKIESFQQL